MNSALRSSELSLPDPPLCLRRRLGFFEALRDLLPLGLQLAESDEDESPSLELGSGEVSGLPPNSLLMDDLLLEGFRPGVLFPLLSDGLSERPDEPELDKDEG